MREIKVAVQQGSKAPQELADLLEGHSRVNPDKIDLSKLDYDVDVLIIGGGRCLVRRAALLAQEQGVNVLLVTKLRLGDANTVGAQSRYAGCGIGRRFSSNSLSGY